MTTVAETGAGSASAPDAGKAAAHTWSEGDRPPSPTLSAEQAHLLPRGLRGADPVLRAGAWSLALLAHAGLLYALLREPADPRAGGGGEVEAISVTIVTSNVLESREATRSQDPAAAAEAMASSDGEPETADAAPSAPRDEEARSRLAEEVPETEKPAQERAVDTVRPLPPETPDRQARQQPTTAATASGGAAARGPDASDARARSAPAAASAGTARDYARHVALALSRSKPKAPGRFGTVLVKFTIAADGGLASAEIVRSSGSPRLDDTALEAVRRTKFPAPPQGMSVAQLTYEVPYHFR